MIPPIIIFKSWTCLLRVGVYRTGQKAIHLISEDDHQPVVTCTVCLVDEEQADHEVYIKNWSENEGILDTLIYAGVIFPPHDSIICGFCEADVCRLTSEMIRMFEEQIQNY